MPAALGVSEKLLSKRTMALPKNFKMQTCEQMLQALQVLAKTNNLWF